MLRQATEKDIDLIKSLIDYGAKTAKILPRSEEEIRSVIDSFFVFEKGRKIVGCCALEIYNKKLAEVRSLVVHDSHQKKGIGRKLIEACLQRAKEKNIYEVLAITDQVDFFKKSGFHTTLNDQFAMFTRPY